MITKFSTSKNSFSPQFYFALSLLALGVNSCSDVSEETKSTDIGPIQQCNWTYSPSALSSLKSAARNPGFNARFNPTVHISRRGLTIRVIGTLSEEFMSRFGNDMKKVVAAFPYLTPVSQTTLHNVVPEDRNVGPSERVKKGEIRKTSIVNLPAHSVMIVYPASMANTQQGFNTLAGNWTLEVRTREKSDTPDGRFSQFPFLAYSGSTGHAMHGPITPETNLWHLRRGEVSHGCNRMQGEHVTELAVLIGCGANPTQKLCPDPKPGILDDEPVIVMEEVDFVTKPELGKALSEGQFTGNKNDLFSKFVGVDVAYRRWEEELTGKAKVFPKLGGKDAFRLEKRVNSNGVSLESAFVERRIFKTWDNRNTNFVVGRNCK